MTCENCERLEAELDSARARTAKVETALYIIDKTLEAQQDIAKKLRRMITQDRK